MKDLEMGFNQFASYFSSPAEYTKVLNWFRAREKTLKKRIESRSKIAANDQYLHDRMMVQKWLKELAKYNINNIL